MGQHPFLDRCRSNGILSQPAEGPKAGFQHVLPNPEFLSTEVNPIIPKIVCGYHISPPINITNPLSLFRCGGGTADTRLLRVFTVSNLPTSLSMNRNCGRSASTMPVEAPCIRTKRPGNPVDRAFHISLTSWSGRWMRKLSSNGYRKLRSLVPFATGWELK